MDFEKELHEYLIYSYKRAIGISLVVFSLSLLAGSLLMYAIGYVNYNTPSATAVWLSIIIVTIVISIASFVSLKINRMIRLWEKTVGKGSIRRSTLIKMLSLAVFMGIVIVIASVLMLNSYLESLFILLGFGELFWIVYMISSIVMGHKYTEIAFGSMAFIAIFMILVISIRYTEVVYNFGKYYDIALIFPSLAFASSIFGLIVICGIVGFVMLFDSFGRIKGRTRKIIIRHFESAQEKKTKLSINQRSLRNEKRIEKVKPMKSRSKRRNKRNKRR
ncbi:multipass membrane protein [Candidatus Mancarchaeum acidiphilum]|uniref:Multipass membrane protein n=1 Tax=Candidatus Mancarchaeum acidiphilum TaxID=1920749 RepID=A0A218NN22_9ARCH|nr:hypothetical protein [Candidatus Mancarchaeum acidiphilum]ASI13878.1 multipass membrane protein [Candidatus Mancarchaeum acidiphilum]